MAKQITCPKCGSQDINVQIVTETKIKYRGCLGWLLWILLAIVTFGLILIIPLITNKKINSRSRKHAVCQNCGYSWILRR